MGLDFIRRAAKTFTKTWNRGANELSQPTLFARHPECQTRSVVASLNDQENISDGEKLTLFAESSKLFLVREHYRVGEIDNPPSDLLRAIQESGGCAYGQIVKINPISGTAYVEVQ